MTKVIFVKTGYESCESIFNVKCDFELGKEWCDNCAENYEGESQEVIDELVESGYDVDDIYQCEFKNDNYDKYQIFRVEISGKRTKKPNLTIVECQ